MTTNENNKKNITIFSHNPELFKRFTFLFILIRGRLNLMFFRYVHVESIFLCRLKTTCSFSKLFYSLLTITNIMYIFLQCTRAESLHSFLPTFRSFAERETILSEQNGKVNV